MELNKRIKITIIGDSLIFRNGLKMLISKEKDLNVVGEFSSISEFKNENKIDPEIILINSPEMQNGDFETFLKDQGKKFSTIVITNSLDSKTHQKYLLSGANGVVTKQQSSEILFKAIRQVGTDELWFRRKVIKETIEKLIREKGQVPQKKQSDSYNSLTVREKEVLESICKGMKNKAIADHLYITETTVRHHLTSIFEKLKVKSRLSLAILAFNEGFVEVPKKEKNSDADYV